MGSREFWIELVSSISRQTPKRKKGYISVLTVDRIGMMKHKHVSPENLIGTSIGNLKEAP